MLGVIDDLATATPITVRMTKIIAAVLGKIPLAEINKVNSFTERMQHMKQHYLASPAHTICGQRARYWTESYRTTEGEHSGKAASKSLRERAREEGHPHSRRQFWWARRPGISGARTLASSSCRFTSQPSSISARNVTAGSEVSWCTPVCR